MKKVAWILSLAFMMTLPATAQKDKRAQTILDAMSNYYKSLKSYQAMFTFASAGGGSKESYKGDLTVKSTKFHLLLGGQEIFTDGKTLYTYIKESNEVNVQDYESGNVGEVNPAQIYSMYKKGFAYRFLKEQKQGSRTVEVIELTPDRPKSPIASVQISVDKADRTVRNWLIINKDGKRTSYTITKFTPNVNASDALFAFNKAKYPGVEVVDLR
jgi:outer membrane lipoprotein-sorting protein